MTARAALAVVFMTGAGWMAACGGETFKEPLTLDGVVVSAETLNQGKHFFDRYCASCHGYDGRADTSAARNLDPRPRDFVDGDFKHTDNPQRPSDADLLQVVRHGVPGTGMPAWAHLRDADLIAIIQYIKAFSPRWRAPVETPKTRARTLLPASRRAASFRGGQNTMNSDSFLRGVIRASKPTDAHPSRSESSTHGS